jgi:UDP-2,3-diacylglucosamine hydrolase
MLSPSDYYVFGHRHLPIEYAIDKAKYLNIGDWIKYNSYAEFDGQQLKLCYYNS